MEHVKARWSIRRRDGKWQVLDRGIVWDSFHSLEVAHTCATQNAVADVLYSDGGLACLADLKQKAQANHG